MENVRIIIPKIKYLSVNAPTQDYTCWEIPRIPYEFIVEGTKQNMRKEFIDELTNMLCSCPNSQSMIEAIMCIRNKYAKDFEKHRRD